MANNVGRPKAKQLIELSDGSLWEFTREQWILFLSEAISTMAAKGQTKFDLETWKQVKNKPDEPSRQHEAITPCGKTVPELLVLLSGKADLIEKESK